MLMCTFQPRACPNRAFCSKTPQASGIVQRAALVEFRHCPQLYSSAEGPQLLGASM